MKKIIKSIMNKIGFDVVRYKSPLVNNLNIDEKLGYELENEATTCIHIVKNNTMLSKRRLVTLFQQAEYCERYNIHGAFVECGVWKGGAAGLMALANLQYGQARRHIHLFDAFQEICEPDSSVDGKEALQDAQKYTGRVGDYSGALKPLTGIYDSMGGPGTLDQNIELLERTIGYPEEFLHYHIGWFQETLPVVHELVGPIAILRLDGDWYASTKVCLEHLFEKVVSGGVVIIDDYGTYEGCRRAVDEYMNSNNVQAYLASIDNDCRFFIKR